MLYTTTLTADENKETIRESDWEFRFTENEFGTFLGTNFIKINLNKLKVEDKEKLFNISETGCTCSIPENIRWMNNSKNMNPMFGYVGRRTRDKSEQHIIFLTIDNTYELLRFTTKHRISLTYHKNNQYVGCCLVFTEEEVKKNNEIIALSLRCKDDEGNDTYKTITIKKVEGNNNLLISETLTSPDEVYRIKDYTQSCFRIISRKNELLTNTYLVSKDKEESIKEVTKYMNANIIVVDNIDNLPDIMKEELLDKKIKSITICGLRINPDLFAENRLIYVFSYNEQYKTLKCLKCK